MTQREVLIDPFSPKAVSDEWTSSNLTGAAPSQQPCRSSPWLFLDGCVTMTKKLNLFRYHFSHLLMGISLSQPWAFLSQAARGKCAVGLHCIINIFLARFCHFIFSLVGSCPSLLALFSPRVQTSEGGNFRVVAFACVDWDSHKKFWPPCYIICLVSWNFCCSNKWGKELWKRQNLIRYDAFPASL